MNKVCMQYEVTSKDKAERNVREEGELTERGSGGEKTSLPH